MKVSIIGGKHAGSVGILIKAFKTLSKVQLPGKYHSVYDSWEWAGETDIYVVDNRFISGESLSKYHAKKAAMEVESAKTKLKGLLLKYKKAESEEEANKIIKSYCAEVFA